MPVPVTKYRCHYKCGHKAFNSKKEAKVHEDKCWMNPDNKTCRTCCNELYTPFEGRDCEHPVGSRWCTEIKANKSGNFFPITNCPYHNKIYDDATERTDNKA